MALYPLGTSSRRHLIFRRISSLSLLFTLAWCAPAPSLSAAQSEPVGYLRLTIPAGRAVALSLPLRTLAAYVGHISAAGPQSLTTADAGWTTGSFGPFATNPCIVRMTSGPATGRFFKIASHSADTLQLDTAQNITALVSLGDRYEIVAADTLQDLFGAAGTGLATNAAADLADNVLIRVNSGWLTYFNDGTKWLRQGAGTEPQNLTAILPDQGFLFLRRGTTPLDLMLTGRVPVTPQVTSLPGENTVFVANGFPADIALVDLGLHLLPGWASSPDPAAADSVQFRVAPGWLTYFHDGSKWLRLAGGSTAQNPTIPKGSAIVINRRGNTAVTLSKEPPYPLP